MKVKKDKNARELVVVGLIRDGNGNVLVQQRVDGKYTRADSKWEFPGGEVEFGELPHEALAREIREEVGCEVSVGRLVPTVHSRVWERSDGVRVHLVVLCYECWYISGTPTIEKEKTKAVAWRTPAQIAAMDILDGIPLFMAAAGLTAKGYMSGEIARIGG